MKIGFTGTQNGCTDQQLTSLIEIIGVLDDIVEAHEGDCIGADEEFVAVCRAIIPDAKIHCWPPSKTHKRAFAEYDVIHEEHEFLVRNRHIARESDLIIACPKGTKETLRSGTWATVRYARHNKKIIVIIWPDGTCKFEV